MGRDHLERNRPSGEPRLAIELDRANGKFLLGDTITGKVVAAAWGDSRVRELTVGLRWRARGLRHRDAGTIATHTLVAEDTHDSARREYPFELRIPADTAPSYRGLFGVAWCVTATADIAWARDRHAERVIRIDQHPHERRPAAKDPPRLIRERSGPAPGQPGKTVRPSLVALAGSAAAIALPWITSLGGSLVYGLAALGGIGALTIPIHIGETVIRTRRQRVTGALRLVASRAVRPGDPLFVELQLSPRNPALIEGAEYTLTAHERISRQRGESSSSREHERLIARAVVDAPTRRRDEAARTGPYRGGTSALAPPNVPPLDDAALGYGAAIELPRDLPTSFRLRGDDRTFSRTYSLEVVLRIRRRRDWQAGFALDVVDG